MGDPAAKVTSALITARDELQYALDVLRRDKDDVYDEGRRALPELTILIADIRELMSNA